MTKRFKLIGMIVAGVLSVSGIGMIAYAAALIEKSIKHSITYSPADATLTASYYIFNGLEYGDPNSIYSGSESITTDLGKVTLTDSDSYIEYKFIFSTAYNSIDYVIAVDINDDLYCKYAEVKKNGNEPPANSDFFVYEKDKKISGNFDPDGLTIYVRIGIMAGASRGDKSITIDITCNKGS